MELPAEILAAGVLVPGVTWLTSTNEELPAPWGRGGGTIPARAPYGTPGSGRRYVFRPPFTGEARPGHDPGHRHAVSRGRSCACGAWLGCLGLEPTPELYVAHLVEVFREVRRVLRDDGTLWLNLGDSYSGGGRACHASGSQSKRQNAAQDGPPRAPTPPGLKPKDLVGIPWRVAFALQADGWTLRSDIIWHKPNPMPESVADRPTKGREYLFLLAKSGRYYYDGVAIAEPAVSAHGSGDGYRRDARLSHRDAGGARGSDTSWEPSMTRNRRTVWAVPV